MKKSRILMSAAVVLVLALVAAFLWDQYQGHFCTKLGCDDSVAYLIPDEAYVAWGAEPKVPVLVETCLDDECQTVEVTVNRHGELRGYGGGLSFVRGAHDLGGVHTVTLKVTDPAGMVRYARTDSGVTLTEDYPNGPDCDGACFSWSLALEPEDIGL